MYKSNFRNMLNVIRPIPFYDFVLFVVPTQAGYFLPALGEPPVKRNRTTNNA